MYDIDTILDLLNGLDNDIETQERGIKEGKKVRNLEAFIQPYCGGRGKSVWYNSLGKYQIQSRHKKSSPEKNSNCSECDSFQLYQAADGSARMYMGKVSFPLGENAVVLQRLIGIKRLFLYHFTKAFYKRACFADLLTEAFKKVFHVKPLLSGRPIGPSAALHPAASTLRTDADVNLPYCL